MKGAEESPFSVWTSNTKVRVYWRMKMKFFAAVILTAALACGPAYSRDGSRVAGGGGRSGGGGGAGYRGGGVGSGAVVHGGTARGYGGRAYAAGRSFGARSGVAFGGSSYYGRGGRGGYAGRRGYYGWRGYGGGYGYDYGYAYYPAVGGYYYGENESPDDGYYDNSYYGDGDSVSSDYAGNSSSQIGIHVQQALAQRGIYEGAIDGIVGPQTRSAIAAYQGANGLPVTRTIDGRLLASLGVR